MEKPELCYLQASHKVIHRSKLLKAPLRYTCCERVLGGGGGGGGWGGLGGKERYIFDYFNFNITMNYSTVLNHFFIW